MYRAEKYFEKGRKPGAITRFMWWSAGADAKLLEACSYSDHAKYFGLGGIVVATGLLATLSGGYAFYTIFSPKEIQGALVNVTHMPSAVVSGIFGLIWGAIIFNLDRFVVSSTGKGDGTEKITRTEFMNALPRIIMALILSIAIAAPLEIRIFQAEIDAELFKVQKEKIKELNKLTDERFADDVKDATANKKKLKNEILELDKLIKEQNIKLQEEVAGRVGSGKDGYGPAAKQIETYIAKLEQTKKDLDTRNQKKIANLEIDIEKLKEAREEEKVENENQAKKLDGLLQRIIIAEKVAGWKIIWLLRMILIVIETGPIFFKMMVIKSPYDYLEENLKEEIKARAGMIAKSEVHLDKDGKEVVEYTYARAQQIINDKLKLLEAQNNLSQYIIEKWQEKEKSKIDENPDAYINTVEE
jgi:hypothetical protein